MLSRFQSARTFIVIFVLLWLGATISAAQTSLEDFRKVVCDQAGFSANDFSVLEQGQMITKLVPVNDKREVAVCGLVHLNASVEVFVRSFQDNLGQKTNQAILQSGKFSDPPTLEDLQALTLENKDIEDIKRCTAGDCKLKLSAAMMERLRNEVNWTAADYSVQATLLFKRMLLDYVRDYLARGDAALMEYNDRNPGVHLAEEQRALLSGSRYVRDYAPEFSNYLKSFPLHALPGVENAIHWSKIKFGLKPVITIAHVVIYKRQNNIAPQALVASKQIYANHYFDSSLALTALVSIRTSSTTADSYLLYTNRSRADALAGRFGGFKRSIVESRALNELRIFLQETTAALEAGSNQSHPAVHFSEAPNMLLGWAQFCFVGTRWTWWLVLIIVIVLIWFSKFASKRVRR